MISKVARSEGKKRRGVWSLENAPNTHLRLSVKSSGSELSVELYALAQPLPKLLLSEAPVPLIPSG